MEISNSERSLFIAASNSRRKMAKKSISRQKRHVILEQNDKLLELIDVLFMNINKLININGSHRIMDDLKTPSYRKFCFRTLKQVVIEIVEKVKRLHALIRGKEIKPWLKHIGLVMRKMLRMLDTFFYGLEILAKHDTTGLEDNIRLFNKFSTYELKLYRKHLKIAEGEIKSMLPQCRARSDEKYERILKKNSTLIKLRSSRFEKEILENTAMQVSGSKAEPIQSDMKNSRAISGTNKRKRQSDHGDYMCQQSAKRGKMSQLCTNGTNELYNGQINNKIHTYTPNVSMIVRKRKLPAQNEHNDNHDRRDIQSPIVKRARLGHVAVPREWNYDNRFVDNFGFVKTFPKFPQNEHNNNHDQRDIQPTNSTTATLEHLTVPRLCNNNSNNVSNDGFLRSVPKCAQNENINNHDQRDIQSPNSKRATLEHFTVPSLCNNVSNGGFLRSVPKCAQNENINNHDQRDIQSTNSKRATLEHFPVPSLCNNVSNGGFLRSVPKCAQNENNNNHDQRDIQPTNSKRATLEHFTVPSQCNNENKNAVNSGYMTNVLSLKASMKFMNRSLKSKQNSNYQNGSHLLRPKSNERIGNVTSNLKTSFPCLSMHNDTNNRGSDRQAHYFAQIEL